MAIKIGIGRFAVYRGSGAGTSWSSYWLTRKPSNLVVTSVTTTTASVIWDDAAEASDGLKLYLSTNGGTTYTYNQTVAFGVETASITGLTPNTNYKIKLVAYKATNESDAITDSTKTLELWYLAGGVPLANCKGAYQGVGVADLATAKINLANPGVNDLGGGVDPTHDPALGFIFDGSSQYLTTGIVPENDQTWSMIIRYSEYTTGDDTIAGLYEDATNSFYLQLKSSTNKRTFANGRVFDLNTTVAAGVICVAGAKKYFNGIDVGGLDIGAPSGNITYDIWVGCVHYTSATGFFDGNIQALAIYDKVLTPAEVYVISTRMANIEVTDIELRQNYVNQGFGALVCFNNISFTESEAITDATLAVDTFAPTDLDIDQWLDSCVDAGMTYACLTAKAHMGFCLWPTAFTVAPHAPYSIESTAWYAANGSPDIVKLFVDSCRSRGLGVGLYFSIYDITWETRAGKDETTDAAAYIAMIETQLSELLSNYGVIDSIWLDGWGWKIGYEEITYATIYNYIKSIQPNCLIIENSHTHPSVTSQIELYEHDTDGHIPAGNLRLSEEVNTIRNDVHWYFHPLHDQTATGLQSSASLNADKVQCNARNGTYLLGITPGTDGHLPAAQVTILQEIGAL